MIEDECEECGEAEGECIENDEGRMLCPYCYDAWVEENSY